jgi:oligopeptide/dipeptide ABC transporter ATP-binding protein
MREKILEIKNIKVYFPIKKGILLKTVGYIKAVDGVDLQIYKGESLALVGESGSGKTTLARAILRLIPIQSGSVCYNGKNIFNLSKIELQKLREKIQIVFQNPFSSLNPRKTVGSILIEPLIFHKKIKKETAIKEAVKILNLVGLKEDAFYRYPHEFSGGQQQRISIARALILKPEFIVLDEPVSSLDVSIQAQILNLLKELQKKLKLTYLFISHNLSIVRFFCNRIAVLYLGKIVEIAPTEELFKKPLHPYTKLLLNSIPTIDEKRKISFNNLKNSDYPTLFYNNSYCKFYYRCQFKMPKCRINEPNLIKFSKNHLCRCFLLDK